MDQEFENGGDKPLCVPGIGCKIDYELPREKRFAHGLSDWTQKPRLTIREVSMLKLMDALTDKPDWSRKVVDDKIVEKWHKEALTMPLISERAWEWCLAELRDRADYFEKHGFVLTLDTGSRCAKSDTLIDTSLQNELVRGVQPLLQRTQKDWHPNSNEQVLNLVHPSLFPLAYGKSRVMETGQVGLQNCIEACDKGTIAPADHELEERRDDPGRVGWIRNAGRWSTRFQWLPCEVKFTGDKGTGVHISSYINNLHPASHEDLYGVIEKLIGKAIPLWNETLIRANPLQHGRTPPRIQTFGHESDPASVPNWNQTLEHDPEKLGYPESLEKVRQYLALPDNPDRADDEIDNHDEKYINGTWEQERYKFHGALEWKFKRIRKILHPEPGSGYSYEDWKAGRTNVTSVAQAHRPSTMEHEYYSINLEDEFREQGFQVIVKLASIELTPEKPDYAGGNWHLEGMLNEHIVSTAIYYYDVSNATQSRIRFRQEAYVEYTEMHYEQDDHGPLSEIFGTESLRDEPAVQELGSVTTPHGRLLCFPNTLQHKVEPFSLADRTQPGHRRFLVLWLVDPNYRIASTANVPPQQHDWWEPHTIRRVMMNSGLPPELQDLVREETGEWPIGMEEAKRLRLELMSERTKLMPTVEGNFDEYNFCEH